MKRKIIFSLILMLTFSPLFSVSSQAAYFDKSGILLKLNNAYLIYSSRTMPFVNKDHRILVPLRLISDSLSNSQISWNNADKSIELVSPQLNIRSKLGENVVIINGSNVPTDTSFLNKNGTIMVPVRWIAEGLNAKWTYDKKSRVLSIDHELFFQPGSKLERMTDADHVNPNESLPLVPEKISYDTNKNADYNDLHITVRNHSNESIDHVEDHLFAYIDKKNQFSIGTRGQPLGDSSDIRNITSFEPNQSYTYRLQINELHNIGSTGKSAEYVLIHFYTKD